MYDVTTGRWTQTDPERYVDGPNMYEFVSDDPTAMTDPTGLQGTASQPASKPTTQPTSQPVTEPGNTWDLLGPDGKLTQAFIDHYISEHNWVRTWQDAGLTAPPYDPCGDGTFRPRVGLRTQRNTLQIGNADLLPRGQAVLLETLIDGFNQFSQRHEDEMDKRLKDIYCSCSNKTGQDDWNRRLAEADALSKTSELETRDMQKQLDLLEQIINAAGIPTPPALRISQKHYAK